MSFKGYNSILFDFSSIVDIEISVIRFIEGEYRDMELPYLDKNRIITSNDDTFRFYRINGKEDLFKSIIIGDEYKTKYSQIIDDIVEENESEILSKYARKTAMGSLLRAYKLAGNGIIKTTIRCSNDIEKNYINNSFPWVDIVVGERPKIDTSKYCRIIVGNYRDALEYTLLEPKSILILNFRENFTDEDSTMLRPELVINLGDVHDINVISAYRDEDIKQKIMEDTNNE